MRTLIQGLCMSVLFVLLGVFAGGQQAEAKKSSFKRHVWPTFKRYCRSCHSPKKARRKKPARPAAGGLDLSSRKKALASLVNQLSKQTKTEYYLVMPGQAAYSYLLFKLQGNHIKAGGKGKRCPQGKGKKKGKKLATWRFNRIFKWVQQGAKNN